MIHDLALVVEIERPQASGLAEHTTQGGIARKLLQRPRQSGNVAERHEIAGLAIDDFLARAADVGGDDGQAGQHCLDDRTRHAFAMRGQGEDIGGPQKRGDIAANTPGSPSQDEIRAVIADAI